ncbi:hypothetical protein K8R66_05075, partial [bacterium]|nr:hypothetical protein [bacterium]
NINERERIYIVWKTKVKKHISIHATLLEDHILDHVKDIDVSDIEKNGNIFLRGIKKFIKPLKTWKRELLS